MTQLQKKRQIDAFPLGYACIQQQPIPTFVIIVQFYIVCMIDNFVGDGSNQLLALAFVTLDRIVVQLE